MTTYSQENFFSPVKLLFVNKIEGKRFKREVSLCIFLKLQNVNTCQLNTKLKFTGKHEREMS